MDVNKLNYIFNLYLHTLFIKNIIIKRFECKQT